MLNLNLLFGESLPKASERLKLICFVAGSEGLSFTNLKETYNRFHLPQIKNWSRDFSNLKANKETFVKDECVFLTPSAKKRIETEYQAYIEVEDDFDLGDFGNFNNLNALDIDAARNMSKIYCQLHLFENSVRKFMEKVFVETIGSDWWDKVANASNRQKHDRRLENEKSKKWLPSRIERGPLYSLDWIDLVKMMSRQEEKFESYFSDINFFHRFTDLYGLRNVIAHNGYFDDEESLLRIQLCIKDWIKQTSV